MPPFDDLTERLTRRLRMDPELRMDIVRELRAHLEDSAAEFRRAGYSDADAQAVKALGDETELTQALWLANRKRIQFRRVAKWFGRLVLVPAAVVIAIAMGLHLLDTFFLMNDFSSLENFSSRRTSGWPTNLTEEQRFIFFGDPTAKTRLAAGKSIADRWPDNPVYYGNYVIQCLSEYPLEYDPTRRLDGRKLAQILPILDRGERLEPENAFYNFMKAAYLFNHSSTVQDDPSCTYETISWQGKRKNPKSDRNIRNCVRVKIHDQMQFNRGLEEFKKGVLKPYYNSHTHDMAQIRLSLLGPTSGYNDYLQRMGLSMSVLLPDLGSHRRIAQTVSGYARELADRGSKDQAIALIKGGEVFAAKTGVTGDFIIALIMAMSTRQTVLGHAVSVYETLGLDNLARQAQSSFKEEKLFTGSIYGAPEPNQVDLRRQGGFIQNRLVPVVPGSWQDYGPLRTTEFILAERMALVWLLGLIVVAALWEGAISLFRLLRTRGQSDSPKLLFVGAGRTARIFVSAVVLPLAGYAVYAYGVAPAKRNFGLDFAWDRTGIELVFLGFTIFLLLFRQSRIALFQRIAEAGITTPGLIVFNMTAL